MRSSEIDMLSEYENMVFLGSENVNSIQRGLAITINGSTSHNDTETLS